MMSAMDELVNKNKRVNLEDMYRGVWRGGALGACVGRGAWGETCGSTGALGWRPETGRSYGSSYRRP